MNSNLVPPGGEPKTRKDLLDPKWKGKIAMAIPWAPGFAWYELAYSFQDYGQTWIDAFVAQQPIIIPAGQNANQLLARGEFALCVAACGGTQATALLKENAPIRVAWLDDYFYVSPIGPTLIKNAPHPNAARVFINWFFTPAGQQFLTQEVAAFPNQAGIPLTQPWQQGWTRPKEIRWFNRDSDGALGLQWQKKAEVLFKK